MIFCAAEGIAAPCRSERIHRAWDPESLDLGEVGNEAIGATEAVSWSKGAAPGFDVKRVEEGLIDVKNHFL